MSTLEEKAAAAKDKMIQANPSVVPGQAKGERKRIPMSLPIQKLQVPDIPGYHLHWMRGSAGRIQQAQNAGYEFVRPDEVALNNVGIGGDADKTGNTDMGDRVSVISGDTDEQNQAVRLYLMKQPMEFYLADQKIAQGRNDDIADTLTAGYRSGTVGGTADGETRVDLGQRYVDPKRTKVPDLFKRKGR